MPRPRISSKSEDSKPKEDNTLLAFSHEVRNPVWLSISEAAKFSGVNTKTIRRAIQSKHIKYKIVKNRYLIDLGSVLRFLYTTTKLRNKLNEYGIGQFVEKWRE